MISVCMATFNGEKYIEEQLKSILAQLGENDEVVISDDGSKDDTLMIINGLNDKRIKVFLNEGTHGFTHNFENALSKCSGDYIFLSDQDDIWREDKIQLTMDKLKKYDFVISDCKTIDINKNVISESRFEDFNMKPGFWRHVVKSRFLGCCMAFRKCVLDAALPFPENDSLVEHDIWLAAIAFKYFNTYLLKQPLIYYRRHGNNASEGGFTKGYSLVNKVYRRIYRIRKVFGVRKRIINLKSKTESNN